MNVQVRSYLPQDREILSDLWVAAWDVTFAEIDFRSRRAWIIDHLAAASEVGLVRCAEVNGRLVGFLTLERGCTHIEQLAVAPAMYGQNIGGSLCNDAKSLSSGWLTLTVNQDNLRAVRFYEHQGFSIVSGSVNPGGHRSIWHMRWDKDPA